MSSFHEHDEWVDDELRRVPLPPGLIARLRQIVVATDADLDALLCEVDVPRGLLLRLRDIPDYADEHVDAGLRDVPIPPSLVESLQTIPTYGDEHIHAQLRDIAVPPGLMDRLAAIAEEESVTSAAGRSRDSAVAMRRGRRTSFWRMATAASIIMVISLSYLLAIGGIVSTAYRDPPEPTWTLVVRQPPLDLDLRPVDVENLVHIAIFTPTPEQPASLAEPQPREWRVEDTPIDPRALAEGPYAELQKRMAEVDFSQLTIPPFAGQIDRNEAPLQVVADIQPRGFSPPWGDAEQLLFQMRHGVHPFQRPNGDKKRATSPIPLGATTDSYEQAWEMIGQPAADQAMVKAVARRLARTVRTEEFLQAIDYDLRAPETEPLGIRAFGGPSPFGEPGMRLLQILVQASEKSLPARPAAHLTIAVDMSASMANAEALKTTRRVLHDFAAQLGPRDQISLVAFNDEAHLLVDGIGPGELRVWHAAVEMLRPTGATNLGEGLRLATSVARNRQVDPSKPGSLVLITDGADSLSPTMLARVEELLGADNQDAHRRPRLAVVQVGAELAQRPALLRLAAAGRGQLSRARNGQEMTWVLDEALSGQPSVIAEGARLSVTFNPDAVEAFRLLGHEATSAVGLMDAPVEIDLHAGQTCSGLFEVILKPDGANHVGQVELKWREAGTSRPRRLVQPISRVQFAPSFLEAPAPLQAATLAAETGELLRGSYFVSRPSSSLQAVRRLADQVDASLADQPSFRRLVRFLDRAIQSGLR